MPVYGGVEAEHLTTALDSLLQQTTPPDEIVVVEDGPLTPRHCKVLDDLERRHARVVRVKFAENLGAGVANQAGIEAASGVWIAKVDADDISVANRLSSQLAAVETTHADVCGAAMLEFVRSPDNVLSIRTMPMAHHQIARRMRWNNPVNHPTAFYRRQTALDAGGYPPWRNMQDYGLFARMLAAGARMVNLREPLVLFRVSDQVTRRRRSVTIRRLEWSIQEELHRLGIVRWPHTLLNLGWRSSFRLLPASAVDLVSRRVLARRPAASTSRDIAR